MKMINSAAQASAVESSSKKPKTEPPVEKTAVVDNMEEI